MSKAEDQQARGTPGPDSLARRGAAEGAEPLASAAGGAPFRAETPSPALAIDDDDTLALPQPGRSSRAATEADIVLEVEVQEVAGDTVIGVTVEEVMAPEALGSRERLVAAEPIASEPVELPAVERSDRQQVVEEMGPGILADETDVEETAEAEMEEAPLSSRRPVGPQPEERLAEMAFGAEEEPPRHTPPPESGRLPAAPAVEFDADVTGVREATPLAPVRIQENEPSPLRAASPPPARDFAPEAIHAVLPSGNGVAEVIGKAQRFQPGDVRRAPGREPGALRSMERRANHDRPRGLARPANHPVARRRPWSARCAQTSPRARGASSSSSASRVPRPCLPRGPSSSPRPGAQGARAPEGRTRPGRLRARRRRAGGLRLRRRRVAGGADDDAAATPDRDDAAPGGRRARGARRAARFAGRAR